MKISSSAKLDPRTGKQIGELRYELSETGKTIFVTTHYMDETETLVPT